MASQSPIVDLLSKAWWLLMLRGLAALLFGIIAFSMPEMTIQFLIIYWAIYILLDGVFSIAATFTGGSLAPRWWLIITGLVGVIAGIFCISNASYVASFFMQVLGWMAIFKGVVELIGALSLKSHGGKMGLLLLSALVSLLFGAWLVSHPDDGAKALLWLIALFATVVGAVLIVLSLQLRSHSKSLPKTIDV
ncbi:HdeD family acid-resistance protein [Rubritalea tangerina]|uniref:HdeD family acid-resistance protein n=1 Tax=Rubritalea tangerina TaxID=430798 RepID=A0ABW4Z7G9_9BACT